MRYLLVQSYSGQRMLAVSLEKMKENNINSYFRVEEVYIEKDYRGAGYCKVTYCDTCHENLQWFESLDKFGECKEYESFYNFYREL